MPKTDEEPSARKNQRDLMDDKLRSEDELPLSDSRSWVWKDRQGTQVVVVVGSGHIRAFETLPCRPGENSDSDKATENEDALPGKPKGRLWQQKVESRWIFQSSQTSGNMVDACCF